MDPAESKSVADDSQPRRRLDLILAILILTGAAVVVSHALRIEDAWWDHDEVEHLHAAWLISQGLRPFADFFEAHQPAFWYALLPLTDLGPDRMLTAARFAMLACALGLLWLTFDLALAVSNSRRAAAFGTLLLPGTWVFLRTGLEVRPDIPEVFFLFLSASLWLRWLRGGRVGFAMAAGLAAGLAFVVLHKAAVVFPAFAAGTLAQRGFPLRHRLRHLLALAGGFAVPAAVYFGWLWASGLAADAFFFTGRFMAAIHTSTTLQIHLSPGSLLRTFLSDSPALFLFGAAGLAATVASRPVRAATVFLWTLTFTLGLLIAASRMPNKQFFFPVFVLLAVFASVFFERLDARAAPRPLRWVAPIGVATALALCAVQTPSGRTNQVQRLVHERILARTGPSDPILAEPPWHPIVRRDAGFLWFNIVPFLQAAEQMQAPGVPPDARLDRLRDLLDTPPAAVFAPSEDFLTRVPGLAAYVRDHLHPDPVVPNLFIQGR